MTNKMTNWEDALSPRVKERLTQIGEVKPVSLFGITKEAFVAAVRERMAQENLSFVQALYQVLDEFVEREKKITGVTLACQKGCSHCCKQLITCTQIEMDEIVRFIRGLPREKFILLMRRVRSITGQWREYFKANEFWLKINQMKPISDWAGKSCVFLNDDGACAVYPVRIIDCRTASSTSVCGQAEQKETVIAFSSSPYGVGPARCRFKSEHWANNMILEEQQRLANLPDVKSVQVTPIIHWLLMRKGEIN